MVKTQTGTVKLIAEEAKMTDAEAKRLLETLRVVAVRELQESGAFIFPGIGKFSIREVRARIGRNPKTGAQIEIPAKKRITVNFQKSFKESV